MRKLLWRLMKIPPMLFYAIGLGPVIGRMVLLLTTVGRKSGLPRVTPLQYEEIEGVIYVGSARGHKADWFSNILVNARVGVHVGSRQFNGQADTITEPVQIADFFELRLSRHPKMMGVLLRLEGLPKNPSRAQLEELAANRAMVVIRPDGLGGSLDCT
jgi:deazaflavin-dependent oxidoreductase (nitroreductase family)